MVCRTTRRQELLTRASRYVDSAFIRMGFHGPGLQANVSKQNDLHTCSAMEQRVNGRGSAGGLSSRSAATEGPGRRRWIRLTFAGRERMNGNRRELPLSRVAGHPMRVPHRVCEGSPCGVHPLLEGESRRVRSVASGRLVGGDRPDEARELARARNNDLLLRFAAAGRPLPALAHDA